MVQKGGHMARKRYTAVNHDRPHNTLNYRPPAPVVIKSPFAVAS